MNHKVNSVQSLYDDSVSLYNGVVNGTAVNLINDLNQGIENLKKHMARKGCRSTNSKCSKCS